MNSNQENATSERDAVQEVLSAAEDADNSATPSEAASKPQTAPSTNAGLLSLREQLQELRQRFDATDAQIAGYLRENAEAKPDSGTNGETLTHVQVGLDKLLSKFDEMAPLLAGSPAGSATDNQPVLDAIKKLGDYQNHLAGKIVSSVAKRMMEELNLLRFQQVVHETLTSEWDRREAEAEAKVLREAEEETVALTESEADIELQEMELEDEEENLPEEDPTSEAWSRAIWGSALVDSEGFAPFLEELNRRLLDGDNGIATLAGQLLVFRQAPPEAKPQLLKDVGEAYYRTRLDEATPNHPFEQALITWLENDCDQAGLPNTIEVVHPGERFDKSRHSSTTRGVEVAEVFGWVVLTEGGRVYTRASVAAQ